MGILSRILGFLAPQMNLPDERPSDDDEQQFESELDQQARSEDAGPD